MTLTGGVIVFYVIYVTFHTIVDLGLLIQDNAADGKL
jgi:hypothetical protein